MKKLFPLIVLVLLLCMPFAFATGFTDLNDISGSKFRGTLDLETYILNSGLLSWSSIGKLPTGEYCIKAIPPAIDNPYAADYFLPLDKLQISQNFDFSAEVEYLKAKQDMLQERIDMMKNAFNDDSVQQYKVFADNPIVYQNTDYGMYFTTIYDSLMFGQEAMHIIGLLHQSATNAAVWLNYGAITSSADITMDFNDYIETQLLFNGLMAQMEEYGHLEEAVGYAADALGSAMQSQAGHNNVFQAHDQLKISGDSMGRAEGFFDAGRAADAAGKSHLADELNFFGMMNLAEGLYSAGESYKLKMMVLLMLIDGTFRAGMGLKRNIGEQPDSPCTKPVRSCMVSSLPVSDAEMRACCPKNCPFAYYVQDLSSLCWGGIQTPGGLTGPPGTPPPATLPGGSGGPTGSAGPPAGGTGGGGASSPPGGGAGGAVAALAGEGDKYDALFPIFHFDWNKVPSRAKLDKWCIQAEGLLDKYNRLVASIPEDFTPDPEVVVNANIGSVNTAIGALAKINVPEADINPAKITYDEKPVFVVPGDDAVEILDEYGSKITSIITSTPKADAADLKINPEHYADDLTRADLAFDPAKSYIGDILIGITTAGYLIDTNTGERLRYLGSKAGFDNDQLKLAHERFRLLNKVVEYESNGRALSGGDARAYDEAKKNELLIVLDAITRQHKFELANIKAKDISWEEKNDLIDILRAKTNADLIRAIKGAITDARVKKFVYIYPEHEVVLMALLDKRGMAAEYGEIADINTEILVIMYDIEIADYYAELKAQNMPFEGI